MKLTSKIQDSLEHIKSTNFPQILESGLINLKNYNTNHQFQTIIFRSLSSGAPRMLSLFLSGWVKTYIYGIIIYYSLLNGI